MLVEIALTFSQKESHLWDIRTGSLLNTLKNNNCTGQSSSLAIGGKSQLKKKRRFDGGYNVARGPATCSLILSSQSDRAMMHAYPIGKSTPMTFPIPEKLETLMTSNSGDFCVGGGLSGRLYLWHTSSGHLLKMWDGHYKSVSCVKFTSDDECVVSGGSDSAIHVWSLSNLVSLQSLDESPNPLVSIPYHTIPITDLVLGSCLSARAYGYSVSLDKTLKVWKVSTGELIYTIVFPRALSCVVVDAFETEVYVGSVNGDIYHYSLLESSSTLKEETIPGKETLPGGVRISSETINDGTTNGSLLSSHTDKITGLNLSLDQTLLISTSLDGSCKVWDTLSKQLLRTVGHHKTSVTGLLTFVKPAAMTDPLLVPDIESIVAPFSRYPLKDADSVPSITRGKWVDGDQVSARMAELVGDFVGSQGVQVTSQVELLKTKIVVLEKHVAELKSVNDEMYQTLLTTLPQ